jgi:transglutaminase-like putative cysteine protease
MSQGTVPEDTGLRCALSAIERSIKTHGQSQIAKDWAAKLVSGNATSVRERADLFARDIRVRVHLVNMTGEEAPSFSGAIYLGYGDADDLAAAIGTLCAASGIETRVVLEKVSEHGWTCHLEVKLESGEWYRP